MTHVGELEFYQKTYTDAQTHDVILLEGVKSPIATRITRSYRWLVGSPRMAGLVVQPPYPKTAPPPRVVQADLSPTEFEAEWLKVPIWLRLTVYLLAPILGLDRRWRYSRSRLAKGMSCDDQPSLSELLAISPETGALTQAILHARDKRLIDRLRSELDAPRSQPETLAVIYGAMHMRAVVRELTVQRDFIAGGAEWQTVLTLE